jgi:choline dehydrogenase
MRSGVGPESELGRHRIALHAPLPVGEVLLDHHGTGISWQSSELLNKVTADHVRRTGPLFAPHALVKAASSACLAGSWDLHLVSWTNAANGSDGYEASVGVFHMKPGSAGRLRLRSPDPREQPLVERGFLQDPSDLTTIVEGLELARALADQESLARLLGPEVAPADEPLDSYARLTMRNYFHPAGTCGIGRVVDDSGRVLGVDRLFIADASIMPTIPRANTNLTTVAIAERLAEAI